MKKVNRKFDYMNFNDDYGVVFDAEAYTKEEAIEVFKEEFNWKFSDMNDIQDEYIEVSEEFVKWKPRMSKEDMWYFDIYNNADNHGIYQICDKEEHNAFKVWVLRSCG